MDEEALIWFQDRQDSGLFINWEAFMKASQLQINFVVLVLIFIFIFLGAKIFLLMYGWVWVSSLKKWILKKCVFKMCILKTRF